MTSHGLTQVTHPQRLALIGANGMLAQAVQKLCPSAYEIIALDLPGFDLTRRDSVFSLKESSPDIIINCAAYTNVDGCESRQELAMEVNGQGPGLLADLAKEIDATLVHISTDFVFDGQKTTAYTEEDTPNPLSIYGMSKLRGEQNLLQTGIEKYFILRTSWLYGTGGNNFVETILRLAAERESLTIVADQHGTPTWTEDLARAIFVLLQTRQYGIYHFSDAGECSWCDFAQAIIAEAQINSLPLKLKELTPIPTDAYPLPATRPSYSVMSKIKIATVAGLVIPAWQQSLTSYFKLRLQGEKRVD